MCRYDGLLQTLCDQLQAYTDACLSAGAPVHQWRDPDFCPLPCPPNSHYSLCVSCPETCVGPNVGGPGCVERCVEGCQCDPGFVLSNDRCVPLKDCGCVDPEGAYHPANESWYVESCTQRCLCRGEGVIECHETSCGPSESCQLQDGEYGCHPLVTTTKPPTTTTTRPPPTTPPVECPPNSQYIQCGPACIPSCQEPSSNCTGSCISGCFCDPGYVYRGKRCVPLHECGCLDEHDNYYESGEIVFGDGCSKLCRCAGNYTLSCVDNSCIPTEECREVNGLSSCYPKDTSTCTVSGDPHYTTFDRRYYDFMGNCSYLLAKPCNTTLAPPFAVYADNENRYNVLSVSYLKAVHVHTLGVVVSILKGGVVQVNGTTVNLPANPAQGLSVFQQGTLCTVVADFGVTVRYDGNHYMDIKVTSDYKNVLCGLCGDYNANPNDDFRTPTGQLVTDANEFGHSWNSDPNCNKKPNETIPECTDNELDVFQSPAYCGILLDDKGPFAVCHPRVNPNKFFKDCLFDLCALGGAQSSLCEALESYVKECQDRGVDVGPWRNSTFCPLRCPPNSHYEVCAPVCPPSCTPPSPEQCNSPCAEGCVCDPGYVYSSGQCVKRETCGCQYNGQYYQPGEEFYTEGCQSKCKCEGGVVTCTEGSCPPQHICELQNGQLGCYPISTEDCIISGDPHYTTFDGKYYTFMGTCTYTLARSCQNKTGPWFSVEAKNEERGVAGVSYLRKLYVTVNGVTVTLMKSRRTLVNGLQVSLPHSPSPFISLSLAGQYVTLQTTFGLTVRWDGNHYAQISVPSSYSEQMCGLCGDYDGNSNNDFKKPGGALAGNSDEFGNSWQTEEDEDDRCESDNKPDPPCDPSLEAEVSKPEKCGKLNDTQGPFRDCIKVVDPRTYFLSCVYDMCRYDGLLQTLCDQLQAYTDACLSAGAPVHQWRDPDFCPLPCPPNSHYSLCVSCPETCVGPNVGGPGCVERCVEGCQCDPGFVLSNDRCVPLKDCGCVDPEGAYHPANESWYVESCTQRCLCRGEGVIECHETSCGPSESCQLQDGEYGCHPLVECPPNSQYIQCGPACIPSCQEPSSNCTGSCISGCFCDPGYVYRGKRCVPLHECGCLDEHDNYYESGEIVFGDGCSKLCRCAGNYTLSCVDNSCIPTEECREVNGVSGCYPKDTSTCTVSGDPHYTTFDRRFYDFMGNCSYLLAKPCNTTLAPPFAVYADNENRYNALSVSYLKAVHVHTLGVVVSILKGGVVQVNGTRVNLPANPAQGLSVFQQGTVYTVVADFGVTVRYDGNHYMDIKVTSDYKNVLCGLCGDYNANPNDDFRTPTGQLVTDANEFGHSWNSDPNCNKKPNETIPECTDNELDVFQSPAYCGILLDDKGPFAVCHPRVNPNKFFKDCLFDLCALGGAQSSLCEALESYVKECQDRGVVVGPWRNSTFCPLRCPPNSHYEVCAPVCPPSCTPPSPEQCNSPCAEGCVCDPGYVYSSGQCVKRETCGCQYNGQYYQPGEEFYTEGCQSKCKCEGGVVTCTEGSCPPQHICELQNGQLGCYPISTEDCIISGDPHYTTFDGKYYTFMGTCTYTLARSCQNKTGPWFSVEAKNEERGVAGVSYLRKLYVTVNGVTVTLMKSRRTLVNGLQVSLPHSPSPFISLSLAGQYVTLQTTFGLTVRWDGNHYAQISVPSSYSEQMCGLCGDYDGNSNNDFKKPGGALAGNSDEFGNSWQTEEDEDDRCESDNKPDPPCDPSLEAEVSKPEKCGKLNDTQGPFRDCIKVVDPRTYFLSCVYDMCRYDGLLQTLCDQLQAYTDACLSAGAPVHQWRDPDFCPLPCPPNSHYSLCVSCPETCVGPNVGGPGCVERCVEGCQCDPGFVLSNDRCVPLKDCGCVDPEGAYHPANESWYVESCTQRCLCRGEGVIECHETSCGPSESCQLQDGEYGCHALVECPPNSQYIQCGPACIPSCQEPSSNCTGSCISGCFCDPGYVYRGKRCVPLHECGCLDEHDNYYESGEIVFGDGCSKLCRCAGNYTLSCVDNSCIPMEECREVNGVSGCYPKDTSTCIVSGDPHYTTFDRRYYDFMGNCSYLLAKPCNTTLAPPFAVYADNENRYNVLSVSYLKAVHVHTLGVVVSILKGGVVQVNGTTVNLPANPAQGLSVFQQGTLYTVVADFGVTVRYDGNHYMDIKVTSDYKNVLCGLCGDYNANPNDDFRTPTGQLVTDANEFGHSWNSDPNCNKKPNETIPECTDNELDVFQSPAYCGILLDVKGPFAVCHPRVNPNKFFKDCLYDLCALGGAQSSLCEALESYVKECQDREVDVGPWRNSTFCPLHCPPNSHYEVCAPVCPPSCTPPSQEQCNSSCAEGCVCDPGYVYSSGQCVKRETCGCQYNGQYYQPGEEFYTEGCQSKCKCEGGVVTCTEGSCPPQHICELQNGQLGCYPISTEDCIISGDPHYTTFDGKYYTFMGTCTYTLARSCQNKTGPWFSVEAKNEERGVAGVSYLRKLYVTVNGVTVTLMKSRRTLVNGLQVSLPHSPSPFISLSLAGQYVTLQTTFGLTVRWDGNHYAQISVPSSYSEQMCGLCGDYDGDSNNDFKKPGGSLAGNSDEFGNSWQTEEDEDDRCESDNKPDPPCDPSLEAEVSKPEKCGKLNDTQGPFRDCIKVVDPRTYFLSCVYDMCRYDGLLQTLCDQLQAYTDACLSAGAPVHQWRHPDFCPLPCPPNSHYSLCVSCPETCVGPNVGGPGCVERCVEGCQCNPGFVLSNDRCVPLKDCGCVDPEGAYHPANESWYVESCTQRCLCRGEGVIECHETSCGPSESCQLQDGEYGCHPLDEGICSVSGDPHYVTFDKKVHHFQGSCSYTLTQPCNATSGLPYFSVDTQNEHRGTNKHISYVRAVVVKTQGLEIVLGKGRRTLVNGVRVTPPVSLPGGVKVYLSGTFMVLETDFGLRVRYDGNHHADVTLPSSYRGLLCGLCGNYNDQPSDDNLKPDGKPEPNTDLLGESWQVPDNRTDCSHDGGVDKCDEKVESEAKKPTSCGMITDPNGIFKPCHSVVPPDVYYENCIYDQCGTSGDTVALCQALQSYADLCAQAGVSISWRNNTFCPLKCPVGSHYTPCGTACPPTCQVLDSANTCYQPCVEGCVCDTGLVLSGDKCVPLSQCGCTDKDNNYHPVGDAWFPVPDCSERCVCKGHNSIACDPWQCGPAQVCSVQEGQLGCHSTGQGVCHVAGDPHYYTFDGVMHTFMGTCTYTLVKICNSSQVTAFTIVAKNEERGQPEASYVNSVTISLPAGNITLSKANRVLVDGRRIRTPFAVTQGGTRISSSGVYSVLNTDFGLVVKFDGVHHLEITIPGDYFGKVCGMCGNYNDDSMDDDLMPNGRPAKDVVELGNSWKAEGDSDPGCQPDDREDLNPKCTVAQELQLRSLCADVLLSELFEPCHALLAPKPFLDNCVYDMCEYDGMQETLCDNVEAYAQACQSLGITISWRNNTFCPLPCPPNSHYSPCGAPCPPTCADLFPSDCLQQPSACVEGCQCDAGHVLSDGQCVPLSSCGCVDPDGEYHDVGDSWLNEHCDEKCNCLLGANLTCKPFKCSEHSICALDKDGIRSCRPEKFSKCSISGDPHYRTFDGFNHHYQGLYTYILTQAHDVASSLEPLVIRGKNARRGSNRRITFLHEMYIDVYGVNVRFLQKRKVLVNGEMIHPPLTPRQGLSITLSSRGVQLATDFGLTVRFDGNYQAEVVLPSTYRGAVLGLCGNFDGRANNEYTKPDGTQTRNLNEFGDSWRVSDRQGPASPLTSPDQALHLHRREVEPEPDDGFDTLGCTEAQLSALNSTDQCGALSDPSGPFVACHDILEPNQFQQDCIFDLCAEQQDPQLRCDSYKVYAEACQEEGVKLGPWRQQLSCALSCPGNSTYSSSMTACPASCGDLSAPSACAEPFVTEGCQCASGFTMSGTECVPYTQCGCRYLGRYFLLNESFVTEDCTQSCRCTQTGAVCQPMSCPKQYICTIYDFVRDCYKASPCLNYPCLNGGNCTATSEDTFTCQCPEGFEGSHCEIEKVVSDGLDKLTVILIGVLVPLGVIIIALICVCVCKSSRKRQKYENKELLMDRTRDSFDVDMDSETTRKVTVTKF
ncbi:IgGFc-binding protein-like [Brienomyrus brachyistius]|uniref:IgGFc-binding protein-like n=1 Tax=Brienomyrus brachyistius TaxID=42636 RepID=UPI0020B2980A|nr:IgGFc-binding protein-like [Brienomyrus brachyistius]